MFRFYTLIAAVLGYRMSVGDMLENLRAHSHTYTHAEYIL